MKTSFISVLAITAAVTLAGCATVDVTKTAKGAYAPTNPNEVQILTTFSEAGTFEELATISTTNWSPGDTAKMHNALRAKAAPLGAEAVVLSNSGIDSRNGYLWATGAAIRYSDNAAK